MRFKFKFGERSRGREYPEIEKRCSGYVLTSVASYHKLVLRDQPALGCRPATSTWGDPGSPGLVWQPAWQLADPPRQPAANLPPACSCSATPADLAPYPQQVSKLGPASPAAAVTSWVGGGLDPPTFRRPPSGQPKPNQGGWDWSINNT